MLLHTLKCGPRAPLHARHACKSYEQHENYLVAGSEGHLMELAESKEELREVQAQPALAASGHRIDKILH